MTKTKPAAKIRNVLCPSDLSEKSQKALGFAARLAETLGAQLTACHCSQANWFTQENRLPSEERERIRTTLRDCLANSQSEASGLTWKSLVVENSFDAARDILNLSKECDADLIVMKARPGVLSAFRFGSIVERVIEGANCPVLLLPSRFLTTHDPHLETLEFRRILFDYDFSEATDQLFRVANTLTRDCHAELEVLSVLDPMVERSAEVAPVGFSRTRVQTIVRRRLNDALHSEGRSKMETLTTVEWGRHAETVLDYARSHNIDMICTTLAPPHFYFEKLYSSYLGSLLKDAPCPILVKQSRSPRKLKDLP